MIEQLPEGESIGWMQAPAQWIFSHTVRFTGIVRIVIQDGEGFILIRKGIPLAYYFKYGRIELKDHAALDYFNSHPTIEFNLCKYTAEEFARALKIGNIDERGAEAPGDPGPVKKVTLPSPAVRVSEPAPGFMQQAAQHPVPVQVTSPPVTSPLEELPPDQTEAPQDAILDDGDIKIISQIKKLNGIVVISVFSEDRNIMLTGEAEIETLLKIARSMLATTRKITPRLDWGRFVHMTLQIAEGNVIIAPYRNYHLCLLTTRTINIGHIRRILRDLQQAGEAQ